MTDVYNPFSVLNAMKSKEIDDYWFRSGTPTYLIRLLSHFNENMNEITGKYYATGDAAADDISERLSYDKGVRQGR